MLKLTLRLQVTECDIEGDIEGDIEVTMNVTQETLIAATAPYFLQNNIF